MCCYLFNKEKLFFTAVIRIGIVLIKTHFVALRTFYPTRPTRRRPRVSEVGLWHQHRSGGPLGQWPTRPSSLNPPLGMRRQNGKRQQREWECTYERSHQIRLSRQC